MWKKTIHNRSGSSEWLSAGEVRVCLRGSANQDVPVHTDSLTELFSTQTVHWLTVEPLPRTLCCQLSLFAFTGLRCNQSLYWHLTVGVSVGVCGGWVLGAV